MIILGIDPGFASMGYALLEVREGTPVFVGAGVVRTQKDQRKVLSYNDNCKRAQHLYKKLEELSHGALLFAVEAESWTRMPSDKLLGIARGAIYSVAAARVLPLEQYSPKEMKECLSGKKGTSKADVENILITKHPELGAYLDGLPKSQRNHAADAAACAYTASRCSGIVKFYLNTQRASDPWKLNVELRHFGEEP